MIIKMFNQGKNSGAMATNYLLSEAKHEGFKPQILFGDKEITKQIIANTDRKQKYISGVISFKEGEDLTKEQKFELINQFQKTFAPFKNQDRINFLWVEHRDKGRLEMHFLCPKTDLKTGKAYNISPPGKKNQSFYNHFVRLQNAKYGFEQIDKKPISANSLSASLHQLKLNIAERQSYIENVIDAHKSPARGKRLNTFAKTHFRRFTAMTNALASCIRPLRPIKAEKNLMDSIAAKLNKNPNKYSGSHSLDFSDGKVKLSKTGFH
jgi:Relaxase/Mobilisation nuclease domain